ncbi:hypothetical protein SEA_DIANE_21 [Streptomyces phage Diane]|uniref:Uncharacterized protein n=1 Tax=Streptomyces phage Diane TaxID=2041207 RepID=A0A291LI83_9CAUD|nr:hypothetical protein KGG78_gp21 [Streptomyces phage Diane]ATI18805.1 hypothetical protein SEA_DIANE_21 [Streptomyces phage Diane]
MANAPKRFSRGSTSTTRTNVYTVPASTTAIVTNIVVTNSSTSTATVLIELNGLAIIPNTSIPGNGIFTLDITQVMDAGNTIHVTGSSTTCSYFISGVEVTA